MQIATVDYQHPQAGELFTYSLRTTGFAVLINHPLNWELIQQIYHEWLDFFRSEDKYRYVVSPERKGGLFPTSLSETAKGATKKDLKEFFHIFPSGIYPDEVSDAALYYYQQAFELAKQLLGWIQTYTPSHIQQQYHEPLPNMIEGAESLLRVLRYIPVDTQDEYIRAAAHEDINLITILPAATASGLQVKNTEGEWFDVPVEANSLIINIGDMLQEASGHYYPSTTHRVIKHQGHSIDKERISMPFFLQPRAEVVLSQRYTAGQYHAERMKELKVIQDGKILI